MQLTFPELAAITPFTVLGVLAIEVLGLSATSCQGPLPCQSYVPTGSGHSGSRLAQAGSGCLKAPGAPPTGTTHHRLTPKLDCTVLTESRGSTRIGGATLIPEIAKKVGLY